MSRVIALIVLLSTLGLASGPAVGIDDATKAGRYVYPNFAVKDGDPAALRSAWRRWQRLDRSTYKLSVHNSCFCVERPPIETTVVNERVTSVTYQGDDDELGRKGYDMDRMYFILRNAYANADEVEVSYTQRGVPHRIAIDWNVMIADEEANYTVRLHRLVD